MTKASEVALAFKCELGKIEKEMEKTEKKEEQEKRKGGNRRKKKRRKG